MRFSYLTIAFITGVSQILWLPHLFSLAVIIFPLITIGIFIYFFPRFQQICFLILAFWLGIIWISIAAKEVINKDIPLKFINQNVEVTGKIDSLVSQQPNGLRFEFALETINQQRSHSRILVYWYTYRQNIYQDQHWQFQVKLKLPKAEMNPGGFDQAKWLFSKHINAIAVVSGRADLLSSHTSHPIHFIRHKLLDKIQHYLPPSDERNILEALIVGNQQNITAQQWQILQATGTNHLVAIAGLHIGFIAAFIYGLINILWRRSIFLLKLLPAQNAALILSFIAALFYAAISGFALPAQRALLMFFIYLIAVISNRQVKLIDILALAAMLVVLYDPLSLLNVSFWLSFGALLLIIYGLQGRQNHSWWWKLGRLQWVLSIGLLPLTLLFFQQGSLTSFIANALVVPYVGFGVLPFCFLAAIFLMLLPLLGKYLIWIASKTLMPGWWYLSLLANDHLLWHQSVISIPAVLLMVVGILWLLSPKGFPARGLGIICFLPMMFPWHSAIQPDNLKITVLDTPYQIYAIVQTDKNYLVNVSSNNNSKIWNYDINPALVALDIKKFITIDKNSSDKNWCDKGGCFSLQHLDDLRFILKINNQYHSVIFLPKLESNEFEQLKNNWNQSDVIILNASNLYDLTRADLNASQFVINQSRGHFRGSDPRVYNIALKGALTITVLGHQLFLSTFPYSQRPHLWWLLGDKAS